ncbi:MAG: DUF4838 domain-containing protein [Clostridia bacterium]|nr:DUF4838 domain-containing protein [Clostridia bacterium]
MNKTVLDFAYEELQKYLKILKVKADISLGLFEDFGITITVPDPYRDDAFQISVKNQKGYIAGSNERSILFGVYRLLEEWGITWVRPGPNGTHYPKSCKATDVEIKEIAEKRHRIMCIEGAVSFENVIDMIDWLPKVYMNGYFIQFSTAHEFFERWYDHQYSTVKKPENHTVEKSKEFVKIMTEEIKKRGLIVQKMGHGWTCTAFGMPDDGWHEYSDDEIPQSFHDVCALVNGERKCWNNRPLQTQLCYSNPKIKQKLVDEVLKYLENNPDTDAVHFWPGDWYNNTCECEECIKDRYTDHYLRIVNSIAEEIAKKGHKTQVVFDVCLNTLWPPVNTEFTHPDNMVLMFAPITRTFSEAFPDKYNVKTIPEYKTNGFVMPVSVDENLAFIPEWKKVFSGDVVDFDYHLMWDHIFDAGGEAISKIAHQDIKNFDNLGFNGFISCQLQRNAFPSSIAMTTIAKALWKSNFDFDAMRRKLYAATFGQDSAELLCDYFSLLSKSFDIGVIRNQKPLNTDEFKAGIEAAIKKMDDMKDCIEAHLGVEDPCHKASWEFLSVHRKIYSLLGKSLIARLGAEYEKAEEYKTQSQQVAFENEDIIQPVLDCMFYARMTNERINFLNPELPPPPLF